MILLTTLATCLDFNERLYSLHNSPWGPFFFLHFAMRVQKLLPRLIQFDRVNASCEQFVIEI